jgi:sarcosine oxidase subunit beta
VSETADAIVIGGGVMGLFCALHLAEQGLGRVVVLEKRFVGAGSSGKSGAILRQHYSHETTVRMARESLMRYRSFHERTGHDIGFRETTMVFVCHERDRAALEANVSLQRGLGVAVEILDAAALRDLEPRGVFGDEVLAACETEAGFVDAPGTLAAVAALSREQAADVREAVRVIGIDLDADRRVRGVRTDADLSIESRVVVNAGGPWAGILCRDLGLNPPLTAIRPEQAFFKPPAAYGRERFVFGDLLTGLYWKPEPSGWTRVGKLAYEGDDKIPDPDDYDEGVSREFIDFCRGRMVERLPAYRDAVSWGGCGALYTVTPDAHALIGEVPGIGGFFLVSGFSGHGFKMGPAVGRSVAGLVTGGTGFDTDFFAVDRFEKGRPVQAAYQYGILG